MKIFFLTIGGVIVASSRTRVYQFLPHLRKAGVEASVIPYDHTETFANIITPAFAGAGPLATPLRKLASLASNLLNALLRPVQTALFLPRLKDYDVIYIQKLALPLFLQKLIKGRNPAIVFDYDDAIFMKDESGYKERFDGMLAMAKLVTVENDYTADYARRLNNSILQMTGPIDCGRYAPRPEPKGPGEDIVIGWIGSDSTTEYLLPLAGALKALCEEFPNVRLEFIGARKMDKFGPKCVYKKWSLETEAADLGNFDIGLMPLPDNEWTRGKGGYKILQYMALGIPSLASPVGINARLIQDGLNGFLVHTPEGWLDRLRALVSTRELRLSMGRTARKLAEDNYSFEHYTPLLLEKLKELSARHE